MPAFGTNQLGYNVKYVNTDGSFTAEFIRQWNQQRATNNDGSDSIAALQAAIDRINNTNIGAGGALTGGGKIGDGNLTITLPAVSSTPGNYGDATHIPVITVDVYGRVIASSQVAASGGGGGATLLPFWLAPPTVPTIAGASFTKVEKTAATGTLTDTSRGVRVTAQAFLAGADNIVLAEQVTPGANFVLTTLLNPLMNHNTFSTFGVYYKESSTGKIVALCCGSESNGLLPAVKRIRWNTISSFNATLATGTFTPAAPLWMRMTANATNVIWEVSQDGELWITVLTESRTAFLTTIDRCGIYFDNCPVTGPTGAAYIMGVTAMSYTCV